MRRSDLIPAWVKVREIYHYYRSLRRGAVLRANQLNYDQSIIDTNNARIKRKSELADGAIIYRHFTFTKYSHMFLRVFSISGVPETLHLEK